MKDEATATQVPTQESPGGAHNSHPETGPIVDITVNGTTVRIHRGRRTVTEIKDAAGVPRADVLEQVVDGQLKELPDDGSVVIKGGEQFVSHVRGAASS